MATGHQPKKEKLRQPVQQRSRETLDRILKAAEKLLESKRFADLSISEIAKEAKCGVGTMYGRFANKEALLEFMEERLVQRIYDRKQEFYASQNWTDVSFKVRIEKLVAQMIKGFKADRAILRELLGQTHGRPAGAAEQSRALMTQQFSDDIKFLLAGMKVKNKRRTEKLIALGLMSIITVLQNRIVQGDTSCIEYGFSDAFFKSELPRMIVTFVESAQLGN